MNGSNGRTRAAGWVLPLALLALPNCYSPAKPTPGSVTRVPLGSTLVECDISTERLCATDIDVAMGVRFTDAAVALVQGDNGKFLGIDDSPAAVARCGPNGEVVRFRGEFPVGSPICVDPAKVGPGLQYESSDAVCVDRCLDFLEATDPPQPDLLSICLQQARASTNVPADPNPLFGGGCTPAGRSIDTFADPRLAGEPVEWTNTVGVDTSNGNILRTAPCTATPCSGFDAGAASLKAATHGDGYLEFSVGEATTNRIGGLTTGLGADDHDVNFTGVGFGLNFFRDGCIYLYENGVPRTPPTPVPATGCVLPANTWGNYVFGARFRITFVDNFDGTATISYAELPGPCTPGSECPAITFFTSSVRGAYPLHVDAGFEDQGGALFDVRLTYIH